jgi:hypothetical protein
MTITGYKQYEHAVIIYIKSSNQDNRTQRLEGSPDDVQECIDMLNKASNSTQKSKCLRDTYIKCLCLESLDIYKQLNSASGEVEFVNESHSQNTNK